MVFESTSKFDHFLPVQTWDGRGGRGEMKVKSMGLENLGSHPSSTAFGLGQVIGPL